MAALAVFLCLRRVGGGRKGPAGENQMREDGANGSGRGRTHYSREKVLSVSSEWLDRSWPLKSSRVSPGGWGRDTEGKRESVKPRGRVETNARAPPPLPSPRSLHPHVFHRLSLLHRRAACRAQSVSRPSSRPRVGAVRQRRSLYDHQSACLLAS